MQGKGRALRLIRAPWKILFERIARMGPESAAPLAFAFPTFGPQPPIFALRLRPRRGLR